MYRQSIKLHNANKQEKTMEMKWGHAHAKQNQCLQFKKKQLHTASNAHITLHTTYAKSG